jgi:hypothetical protein
MEAPTFDAARMELYTQLSSYVFVRLPRRAAVPPERTGESQNGYYHGVAHCLTPEGSNGRVWYQKTAMAQRPIHVGPLTVQPPSPDDPYVPLAGDVFMGKTVPPHSGAQRRGGEGEKNDRLVNWVPFADPWFHLFNLVCNGTAKTEDALAHELRVRSKTGPDDVWALARLVLFGNVRVFADEHKGSVDKKGPMRLSMPPLHFVHACATSLRDESIWTEFVKLVPDAVPPAPPAPVQVQSAPPPPPRPIVRPLARPMSLEESMARTRGDYSAGYSAGHQASHQVEYNPESPAYHQPSYQAAQPHSPPYQPSYQAHSPTYQSSYPHSPTYQPSYQAQPSPYQPHSPAYQTPYQTAPASPPFRVNTPPDSPPYTPTTPPDSPPYRPRSPVRQPREFSPPPLRIDDVSRLLSHVDKIQQRAASHF